MMKIALSILGFVCFLAGTERSLHGDVVPASIFFLIGVLCIGFIGIIEAIEKLK